VTILRRILDELSGAPRALALLEALLTVVLVLIGTAVVARVIPSLVRRALAPHAERRFLDDTRLRTLQPLLESVLRLMRAIVEVPLSYRADLERAMTVITASLRARPRRPEGQRPIPDLGVPRGEVTTAPVGSGAQSVVLRIPPLRLPANVYRCVWPSSLPIADSGTVIVSTAPESDTVASPVGKRFVSVTA
jgi:hypothetical protein